jgi:hypothetical protein
VFVTHFRRHVTLRQRPPLALAIIGMARLDQVAWQATKEIPVTMAGAASVAVTAWGTIRTFLKVGT